MYLKTYQEIKDLISHLLTAFIHDNKTQINKLLNDLRKAASHSEIDYKNFIIMLDSVTNLLQTDIEANDYYSQRNIRNVSPSYLDYYLRKKTVSYLTIINDITYLSAEEDSFYKENATDEERETSLENYSSVLRSTGATIAWFVLSTEKIFAIVINENLGNNIYNCNLRMIKSASEHSTNYLSDLKCSKYKVGDCGISKFDYKSHLIYQLIYTLFWTLTDETKGKGSFLDTIAFTVFAKALFAELKFMLREIEFEEKGSWLSELSSMIPEIKKEETKSLENQTIYDICQYFEKLLRGAAGVDNNHPSLFHDIEKNYPSLFEEQPLAKRFEALNIEAQKEETGQNKVELVG